jgi:hypothetical protein
MLWPDDAKPCFTSNVATGAKDCCVANFPVGVGFGAVKLNFAGILIKDKLFLRFAYKLFLLETP